MATPKKRTSVSRKGMRRAGQHHKLYRKFPMVCPNCKDLTMPHAACPSCGTYKSREIFAIKAAKDEAEEGTTEESQG
ncbi:MAG: 50S ribosomal protein L32 [Oligoflexia bacterium]|nr:50S ribosomal protein L32 [Oligoflexia bacterium]MBF0364470.1 50S ribosomal protein L32 [Oligoflexia bacterium]